jgi:hypothetical protein
MEGVSLCGERRVFYSNLATADPDHTVHILDHRFRGIGPVYENQKAEDLGSMILLMTSS